MKFPGFIGGSYQSQAVTADCERTVNWYPEALQSDGATNQAALYPTPGVLGLSEADTAPGRAHFYETGREFAVIGDTLYEIDLLGNLTSRGTVALDSGPATISTNGDVGGQLFITSGGNGYVYNLATNALTAIAALTGRAAMGAYLDGYFLALDTATSTLLISALGDGATWTPGTDFAQRSIGSDRWLAMRVVGRYIWLWGEFTTEVWWNTGNTFPFEPHPSGVLNYGIIAPFSTGIIGSDVIWLASTKTGRTSVVKASGFAPEVISTYPMDVMMGSATGLPNAVADCYSDMGHTFYLLHLDNEGVTWAWDASTGIWSERGTWQTSDVSVTAGWPPWVVRPPMPGAGTSTLNRIGLPYFVAWRPRFYARAFDQHRMLDSGGGWVYEMSSSIATDVDGLLIRRVRRAPAISDENRRIFYSSFEVDLESGLGLTTGQGEDPQVMLSISNDGGRTWPIQSQRSAGKRGEYLARVEWRRLGSARKRAFEVSVSDPIPWKLTGAYLTMSEANG